MSGLSCPEKGSKEWKRLLKAVDGNEEEAYRIRKAYDNVIPTPEQLKKDGILQKEKKVNKFQPIIDSQLDRKSFLHKQLSNYRREYKEAKGADRVIAGKKIATTEHKIEDINKKIEDLEKIDNVEKIYTYAQSDLNDIRQILNNPKITETDLKRSLRVLKLWQRVSSLDRDNPLFSVNELESFGEEDNLTAQNIATSLKNIQVAAESLETKWNNIAEKILGQRIKNTFGEDAEYDMNRIINDISKSASLLLDIGEIDNIITKAMYTWNKEATHNTNQEINVIFHGIDKVMEHVKKRFSNSQIKELFAQRQSNTDSRKTGNTVSRFTQHYFDWNKLRRDKHNLTIERTTGEAKKNAIIRNNEDIKKHSIMLDARKLFPIDDRFSEDEIAAHKQELINTLGQKGFDFYNERLKKSIEEYNELKEAEESYLNDEYSGDEAAKLMEMQRWEAQNSPYKAADSFYDNTTSKVGNEYINTRNTYTETVPRRTIDGKDTGFYDDNFSKIENDNDLLALYNYLTDTMHNVNQYLPEDVKGELQSNTLPFIRKSVVQSFMQGGVFKGLQSINKNWNEALRTGMGGIIEHSSQRDIEGNKIRGVQFNGMVGNVNQINDYIAQKTIEHNLKVGKGNTSPEEMLELKLEWKKEIQDRLAEEKSFDLEKVIKIYSLAAVSYAHKSKIEDAMSIANTILNDKLEQQLTNAGDEIKNQDKKVAKKGLANLKASLDYFMANFYGEPKVLQEFAFGEKIYNSEEKIKKEQLEKTKQENLDNLTKGNIDKLTFIENEKVLDEQLNKLGGKKTLSGIGDMINSYIRMKGLGWNFFAPIMNFNVGFFTNMTEAAGGLRFDTGQLLRAYGLVLGDKSGKVARLMEKLDTLKEVQNEAYNTVGIAKGAMRRLAPFYLTNKAEYLNQSPIMVAMLLNTKVKVDGKEMSLWEAYDNEANLPSNIEFLQDQQGEFGVKNRIDNIIKAIHGNYDKDAPILANKNIMGRSLLVFRKWMINSYYHRLKSESGMLNPIDNLSDKGRWNSYGDFFKEYGAFGGIFSLTTNLIKKMSFGAISTNFDEKLNEVDAANMRKNLTEIMFMVAITSLALLLKGLTADDKDSDAKYLAMFYINQLGRMERDIMFYIDPRQFKSILRDPLPIMGVLGNASDIMTRSFTLVTGGDDIYKNGYRKGQSKTWASTKQALPGASNIDRLKSMTTSIFNKTAL